MARYFIVQICDTRAGWQDIETTAHLKKNVCIQWMENNKCGQAMRVIRKPHSWHPLNKPMITKSRINMLEFIEQKPQFHYIKQKEKDVHGNELTFFGTTKENIPEKIQIAMDFCQESNELYDLICYKHQCTLILRNQNLPETLWNLGFFEWGNVGYCGNRWFIKEEFKTNDQ